MLSTVNNHSIPRDNIVDKKVIKNLFGYEKSIAFGIHGDECVPDMSVLSIAPVLVHVSYHQRQHMPHVMGYPHTSERCPKYA